ncbi:hypothetical protein ACJRO7_018643 [Eucalyptus globulus]|uniref:Phorbol-ester/DAG-type domain-containing protein n=1 Tax=Eucalyptus globulus TaxID=34317 RepID=A0ABD3L0L9_EUCGL
MEICHFSHKHWLTLYAMDDAGKPCRACSRPIFDFGYVCHDCNFHLHKKCAKLPQSIHHCLHPKHPLTLHFNQSETFECSVCKETDSGFTFRCCECDFNMDVTCFLRNQPCLNLPPREEKTRKLQHFSHNHPLTLCFLTKKDYVKCSGCERQICGPAYRCKVCCQRFTLDKCCAQLPCLKEHPFHPLHTLTLCKKSPYGDTRALCDACKKTICGFVYHCDICQFDLDVVCASLTPSLKHEKHDGCLTFFEEINGQVPCNLCGKSCSNNLYRCISCNFNVHSTCLQFASTVKHKYHPHFLTLKGSTPLKNDPSGIFCATCDKKISPKARAYYCGECSYGVHLECVVSEDQADLGKLLVDVTRVQDDIDAITTRLKPCSRRPRCNCHSVETQLRISIDEDTGMSRNVFQHCHST